MTPSGDKPARDLLDFYLEAGADAVVGETPVDRFADGTPIPPPARGRSADEVRRVGVDERSKGDPPGPHFVRTTLPLQGREKQ